MIGPGRTRCAFCGERTPLTREHVWPRWLSSLLGPAALEGHVSETDGEITRTWFAPTGSMVVKRVCARCNGGWMSRLEEAAKPLLEQLVQGLATTLSPGDQRVIAAWAHKTLAVCDLATGAPVLQHAARESLLEESIPAGGVVLLARYAGERHPLLTARWAGMMSVEIGGVAQQRRVALFTVSFGAVVLQLFSHGIPDAIDMRPTGQKRDFAHVLWPDPLPCFWPLPMALGDEGLRKFASAL